MLSNGDIKTQVPIQELTDKWQKWPTERASWCSGDRGEHQGSRSTRHTGGTARMTYPWRAKDELQGKRQLSWFWKTSCANTGGREAEPQRWKKQCPHRQRHQRDPCSLRGTSVQWFHMTLKTCSALSYISSVEEISILWAPVWLTEAATVTAELGQVNKLASGDGCFYLKAKTDGGWGKITRHTFLCNSQPDLKDNFLLKE